MEFDETIEYYKQEITNLRKKRDFEMLKAVAGDLRDYLRVCGKIGVEVHHLAGRSKMNVYHLPEFLIYVCRDCHKKFHGG